MIIKDKVSFGFYWNLFFFMWGFFCCSLPLVAQVTVDGTVNNIPIQEIRLDVDGTVHLQTADFASRYNPMPYDAPVLVQTILLQDGTEIFATTRTPSVQNLHPNLGTTSIPADGVGVAKFDGTYINHRNAGFVDALEEVVSTPDFRSYWDITGSSIPSGEVFMDVLYPVEVPKSGYLVVSERDGNSKFDFQALDQNGDPIAGAETIQLRGYEWNTRIVNQGNYPAQPQHLVVISPVLFDTTAPIFGFRVINLDGADGKIVFFRNSINVNPDFPEPAFAGSTNVVNVLENDELKELPATTDNVHINILEPEPNNYIVLNPDGSVDISTDAPSGIYVINYSICEIGNDTNCADGTVTVEVMFALPVTWLDFEARELSGGNRILWRTTMAKGNSKYQVWRSKDPLKSNFEKVGEVMELDEGNEVSTYEFMDTLPAGDQPLYYRIDQIDFNGDTSSTDIFKLQRSSILKKPINIHPNPYSKGEIVIKLRADLLPKNGIFLVKNNQGIDLGFYEGKIEDAINPISFFLKNCTPGLYFVVIQTGETRELVKWIKE